MFSGTVSAASVGFRCLCVSRHKVRRRLPAKNAKSRWMALKTLCAKEKMGCCLRAPIIWNETPMLTMYVLSVFFMEFVCFAPCKLFLLLKPFCRILIIPWSVRMLTESLDDARRWNVFLRILLVPQLDVQPHPSPLICLIRSKLASAFQ